MTLSSGTPDNDIEIMHLKKMILLGFSADQNKFKIDDRINIVKSAKAVRNFILQSSGLENKYFLNKRTNEYEYLIEYSYIEKESMYSFPEKAIDVQDALISAFRILKFGIIESNCYQSYFRYNKEDNFQSSSFTQRRMELPIHGEPYHLTKIEIKEFRNFWPIFKKVVNKNSALNIAIRRYNYSFDRYGLEDKLIDLMISAEALFLNEKQELAYRLSLRTAYFLRNEFELDWCFNFMKDMYNLRSTFVHGLKLKMKGKSISEFYDELEDSILILQRIIRVSIKKLITDYQDLGTVEFLNLIDKSILNPQNLARS